MSVLQRLFSIFQSDNLYQQAIDESYKMLDIDLAMYKASVESLRQSDTSEIPIDIFSMDKQINAFERDVRNKILTHICMAGTSELAPGMVLVSIIIDIERIGDYTKNIYDMAVNHPKRLTAGSLEEKLHSVETATGEILEKSIIAFKTQDEIAARHLMASYKTDISPICDEITNSIVSGKTTDLGTSEAAAVALYARYLKRISAHAKNLISSVVNSFERIGYSE
ncbi:MAG: hypothetical protein ISS00_01040 [Candidatus Marinimicrobia bacterium]|nr:hypothetical protein [Candidatus Neomarinimicrobiota bacterium]